MSHLGISGKSDMMKASNLWMSDLVRFEPYSKEKLIEVRKEKGYTQKSFSEYSGIPEPSIKKWESGSRTPSLTNLGELGLYLNVFFFAAHPKKGESPQN